MDELIKQVAEKANLPEAQAKAAVETVVDFLKERLPGPLAGQVDAVLANSDKFDLDKAEGMLKGLSGLLG